MQERLGEHPLWHVPLLPAPFNTVHADTVVITWLVMAILLVVVGALASTHPITVVTKRYSVMELIVSYFSDLATGILGKNGAPYIPFVISLFIFILLMNEIGLFPFIGKSPTADLNTTAALAITTILLIQIIGIRNHGPGYYKHLFMKPPLLGALMLPFMIIDELVRPVTLAMRLFGNIFAGEILLVVVAVVIAAGIVLGSIAVNGNMLAAIYGPLVGTSSIVIAIAFGALHHADTLKGTLFSFGIPISKMANVGPVFIFVFNLLIGVIQALVFTLLTIAYLITPTQEATEH